MTELDRLSHSLEQVRKELSPTSADKDRLRARLLGPPGAGLGGGPGAGLASELRPSSKLGLALGALTVGALLLGAGVMIGIWWGSERTAPSLIEQRLAEPTDSVNEAAPPAAANESLEAAPAVPRQAVARAVSPVSPPRRAARAPGTPKLVRAARAPEIIRSSELDEELALLRRVEHALRENEPTLALALLAELDERHPDTRLAEERLAARRIADCRASRPDASAAARSFLLEHATSVYRQRIQQSCALGEQNPESADTHAR